MECALILVLLSLGIWVGLLLGRGQFWRADQRLRTERVHLDPWPSVQVVIPARNEAEMLPLTLPTLLEQDYPGPLQILVVDDHSSDGTAEIVKEFQQSDSTQPLHLIMAAPLPSGWTGKLWAVDQGIQGFPAPVSDYVLLTDADIAHDRSSVWQLVQKAELEQLDLVSLMVRLRCQSLWERLLIPAFVFFFQKLYPFAWVNDPSHPTAAAAGGCLLIHRAALERIGGIQAVRQALIDDCALAEAVKQSSQGDNRRGIWLGLTETTCSLRPYETLETIWAMVARSAYTQLHYSPLNLLGTVIGMLLIYLVPVVGTGLGLLSSNIWLLLPALLSWILMVIAYWPTLSIYRQPFWLSFCLPVIALLYTLMTIDSARLHLLRQGGSWKGRVYES